MEAALGARVPARVWIGRTLSGLAIAFLGFDALGKLLRVQPVLEGTQQLGYPASAVLPIGVLLALGVALYALPRTAVLGAIYLTAYLGGAVATHFRVGSPLASHTLFPVYVALVLWAGLVLRDPALLGVLVRAKE
jgi:hypothetical protein